MSSKRRRELDTPEGRLRLQARLKGGVLPVPFLGRTWTSRGGAYWRRRVGAVVLFLLLLVLVGGMATGFTIGIVGDGHNAVRVILAVLYDLTAVLGVRTGLRKVAEAPLDDKGGGAGTHVPSGALAFVLAPFGVGLVLTILVAMCGRDFIGERRAREASQPA
ncbi:hypothetical protein [Actinoplanes sp. NPDC051411]|uniref:hypothetical protein n=1 Tax=Actinoplanes sp. NPDC051411 TaxID=3155522 RepID=UPI003443A64F